MCLASARVCEFVWQTAHRCGRVGHVLLKTDIEPAVVGLRGRVAHQLGAPVVQEALPAYGPLGSGPVETTLRTFSCKQL